MRILACVALFSVAPLAAQPSQPPTLSMCEVLRNVRAFDGREVTLTGLHGGDGNEHGNGFGTEDCDGPLVIGGKAWPWGFEISWRPGVKLPAWPRKQVGENFVLTVTGTVGVRTHKGKLEGQGHLNWAPAKFTISRILDFRVERVEYLSVCDVFRMRGEVEGKTIHVRGQLTPANTGYFLRPHQCPSDAAIPAIWIDGYGTPKPLQQPGPDWKRLLEPGFERAPDWLITVRGRIEFAAESNGFGEESRFPVQIHRRSERDFMLAEDEARLKREPSPRPE